jgi:hypothetical protein
LRLIKGNLIGDQIGGSSMGAICGCGIDAGEAEQMFARDYKCSNCGHIFNKKLIWPGQTMPIISGAVVGYRIAGNSASIIIRWPIPTIKVRSGNGSVPGIGDRIVDISVMED